MSSPVIREFQGTHSFLSNFWTAPVKLDGLQYPTVEHAYQAAKTLDANERHSIQNASSPRQAKQLGRKVTKRQDWDTIKFDIMLDLLRQKFYRNGRLAALLTTTGSVVLEEGNLWHDTIWGICRCKKHGTGNNRLGKFLMQIRSELQ